MRIAIVGCGYVGDFYLATLANHPELELAGVFDRDRDRAQRVATYFGIARIYASLDELLADATVELVVNLTNPRSHHAISRAALEAGKHVYSEKPLGMTYEEALDLVELAERRGLRLSSAPCNVLGESAQTLGKALRDGAIGTPWVVYAEMDDGAVHQKPYPFWLNRQGTPWPYKDEFEVGCTFEHAGYYLTWLAAFFGPAESVTAIADVLVPDKRTIEPIDGMAPDLSIGLVRFANGVRARLTCSVLAPDDHALRIVGDKGVLSVRDCWFYGGAVHLRRRQRSMRAPYYLTDPTEVPLVRPAHLAHGYNDPAYEPVHEMDFARGIADLAEAVAAGREPRLSARFSLHVVELTAAISAAGSDGVSTRLRSRFDPIPPMAWAE